MIIQKEPNIRKVYKPSEKELTYLRHVYTRKQQMDDKREFNGRKMTDIWDEADKAWEAFRPPKGVNDWTSDIYVPITTATIESMMSELINQELKPWAVERGSEDQPKALVMNNILDYTWDISKSDVSMFDIMHDAITRGTGIGQEYYWRQPREITGSDGKKQTVMEYDDVFLEPVKLEDFWVDEKARGFWGPYAARDCVRRYIMDIDDFHTFFKQPQWDTFSVQSLVKAGGDTQYYEFFKPPEGFDKTKDVEVLWYWNKPEDLLLIVANDILVFAGPNPYKHKQLPFARMLDTKRTHQFYGKGEAETLESLQEETNTLRRMIIDRNHLDIDKPILVSDTLTMEDEDAIAAPHKVIAVGDVNGAKFAEYSDIPQSVFQSLQLMNDDKIRVTGMDERQQSVSAAGTATEAAILKEATLKRLNMKIWGIKNDFLVDIGRLRVANIIQFYSQPKLEMIVGEVGTASYMARVQQAQSKGNLVVQDGQPMEASYRNIRLKDKALGINGQTGLPEEQQAKGFTFFEARPEFFMPSHGGYDIRYKATSSMPVSKPLYQQKVVEMYDRLASNPTVDPWKLAEAVLKSMEFDPDEFKFQQQEQPGTTEGDNLQKLIDLAGMENGMMIKGQEIPPTPYSSPAHTEIHIAFMKSKEFQQGVPPEATNIIDIFKAHVEGELQAQAQRQGQGGGQPQEGQMPPEAGGGPVQDQGMTADNVMPGRVMGGEENNSGMQGSNAGVSVGRAA